MNDDLTLLASAYLDGDVTDDERALVDADPEALDEVERLRTVRILLGDVEPSSISTREAQLASALDVWDRLPEAERSGARRDRTPVGIDAAAVAGAASVTAPTPLRSDRRRPTSTRWLTGAAAALLLVLVGGVALQLRTGGSDDSSSSADVVPADAADDVAVESAGPLVIDDRADAALAPGGAAATDEATSKLDTGIDNAAPPGESGGLDQLQTPGDLADFAGAAIDAPVSPDVPAATSAASDDDVSQAETFLADVEFPLCLGVDMVVGPALYGDVPVVVGIDDGLNVAIAYRAATCAEVARVRLP